MKTRFTTMLLLGLMACPGLAQEYFSNDAPVKAAQPGGSLMAGSLWQVVCGSLNGRAQPSLQSPVVHVFARGTVLQANVGRGGSDEVLRNALDAQGRPWMWVRSRDGQDLGCYVRANGRFIRPVPARK